MISDVYLMGTGKAILGGIVLLLFLLLLRSFGRNARATRRSGDQNVWGLASEVRSMRFPKGRFFRSKKGLK